MLETIARSALCLRCTNCWRQYCTADFISDLIKSKQKIRQGSDVHIRQWIIWRRTEWLNKDVMSVESKGGLLQLISWRRLISITHNSIWDALKSCGIEHDYIHTLKRLFKNQKDIVMIDEESMFEIKKGSRWSAVELALQHCSADGIERRSSTLAKEKRTGYMLGWQRSWLLHKHEICRRCALICIFRRTATKHVMWLQA